MKFCYSVMGRAGGRYTTLEPYPKEQASLRTRRLKPDWVIGASLLGREIGWRDPYHVKADPELREFGRQWMEYVQGMLNRDEIRPHPVRVGEDNGLEHVLGGIDLLRKKKVSGEKLVYRM